MIDQENPHMDGDDIFSFLFIMILRINHLKCVMGGTYLLLPFTLFIVG